MGEISNLVYKITLFNRNWKRAREQWGEQSDIASMLRGRKQDLQVCLIRDHSNYIYLELDHDNVDGEALYSVRLREPVCLPNGMTRRDADHMPLRLAEDLFSPLELAALVD